MKIWLLYFLYLTYFKPQAWRKIMKKFIIVWLTIFLCGCASAMPNLVNGKYYMGGDSSCSRYRALSDQESWLVSGQMRDYWMIFHSL